VTSESDELVTRAQILHAARNHPGTGHLCGRCLREAAGERQTRRARWRLAVAIAVVATVAAVCSVAPRAAADPAPPPGSVTIAGLDLHDGTIVKDGNQYVLVGTRYGCGFQWGAAGTPWCGFGVSTAPTLTGPWSTPQPLFNPADTSPYSGTSFRALCGQYGAGCFNPRLVQRTGWGPDDGAWILWFNAPADYQRAGANAYYSMGCASAAGPCGVAGGAYASVTKPSLWSCTGNGDFSLVRDDPRPPMMLCTMPDQTLASERLSFWGATGERGTGRQKLAAAVKAEAPGAYRDPATGAWLMTWNEFNCGYCSGSPTSYATSTAIDGAFTSPPNSNTAWGATPLGRRGLSATSCGGQARTVTVLDGQAWQVIDLWGPGGNQAGAAVHLEPLTYRGAAPFGQPHQPFAPFTCGA
jgi:hypothetical protein